MTSNEKEFRVLLCIYPTVVMGRLFKSFAAQPRLALVTDTLVVATPDMLHFFIVFLSVYVCMAVNSILFFGQDVEDFASEPRAFHACFRALFGDWDWDLMNEIGFLKAQVWFWIFQILMALILINVLLAIVMDAYTEVKRKAMDAYTLCKQMSEMNRRRKQSKRGERIKLNEVYDAFLKLHKNNEKEMLSTETPLKPQDICNMCPKMPAKQALRTLTNSLAAKMSAEEDKCVDDDEIKEQIKVCLKNITARTDQIEADAAQIKTTLNVYDRLEIPGDPEFEFHFGSGSMSKSSPQDDQNLAAAITYASKDFQDIFGENLTKIERMQIQLEDEQDKLHSLITEMQMMVAQQQKSVQVMREATSVLVSPREGYVADAEVLS